MTLPLRRAVFWLHLATGCAAGAVVLVMAVTGVLLAYEEQIVGWAERGYRSAAPEPEAVRLPLAVLVARARGAVPEAPPTAVTVDSDPRAPVRVAFGRERRLLVDPYRGRVLGEGARELRDALRTITVWHRWLGGSGEGRAAGRAVTGACNLGFLFLVLSGLYLWVPRSWRRRRVRNVVWFRRGLPAKARDFNWHHVAGLWAWLPLVAIVASGVVMSYPWANGLVYRLAGEPPPPRARAPEPARPERDDGTAAGPDLAVLDLGFAAAARHAPGWRTITLDLPEAPAEPLSVSVTRGGRGRPDLRDRLTVAPSGGAIEVERFADQSRGRRLRSWLRWIHTGEAGGVAGQTVAALGSAAAIVLVWTGIALAWRRLIPRRRASRDRSPASSPPTAAAPANPPAPAAVSLNAVSVNDRTAGARAPRPDGGAS